MAVSRRYLNVRKKSESRLTVSDFTAGLELTLDESVLSAAQARECYNFDFSDGTLKDGYGLSEIDELSGLNVRALWRFRRFTGVWEELLICYLADGRLYYKKEGCELTRLGELTLTSVPSFIDYRLNGEDVALICSPTSGMYVWNGTDEPYRVENAPAITSLALHGERLFVTVDGEKNSVWFSDDLDPTNWDASLSGGGFIQLIDERGSLNRVISFLGYVYVFRSYGITRISALGAQSDFSVSNLFVSGGEIYPDTVALCGDVVLFLASDGLYAFDGVSTHKLLKNIAPLFEKKENSAAAYSDGKYYLSFGFTPDDEPVGCEENESFVNNAMLVYDLSSGAYYLSRGVDVVRFFGSSQGIIAVTSDGRAASIEKNGSLFGRALKKKWSIPRTALSDERRKLVREIYISTATPLTVTMRSDEGSRAIAFDGGTGVQRKKTFFEGRSLGFELVCRSSGAFIARPSIHFIKKNT